KREAEEKTRREEEARAAERRRREREEAEAANEPTIAELLGSSRARHRDTAVAEAKPTAAVEAKPEAVPVAAKSEEIVAKASDLQQNLATDSGTDNPASAFWVGGISKTETVAELNKNEAQPEPKNNLETP